MFIEPPAETSDALAAYYEQQTRSWGFLPHYAACFAHHPEVAAAWRQLSLAAVGTLDRRRFEIATIAAARARRSTYCTVAHASFLRDVCGDEATMRAIAADPSGGSLEPVDHAVFAFAVKVATDASSITADDVAALREVGLGDAEISGVVMAVAARAFFTTVLDALGAQLDRPTADTFDDDVLAAMVVGRPVADD
jgi:uncharacterized peroxidase-related enzyme